jgi:hypothetical protein
MLLGAAIACLVSALFPIWPVWHVGTWEATGELGMLWTSLFYFPFQSSTLWPGVLLEYAVASPLILAIGAALGAIVEYNRRHKFTPESSGQPDP